MIEHRKYGPRKSNGAAALRVGVLDLNNGVKNLGLRSIVEAVDNFASSSDIDPVEIDVFDVRRHAEVPGAGYHLFISSGGPGSPFDGEGTAWEANYFDWLERVYREGTPTLLICHSFELMVRCFGLAVVNERRSPSFGIYPVHLTEAGRTDQVLCGLDDPFCAADFRDWQVVEANADRFEELGVSILAKEKIRPHVPLERAIMALRIGPNMLGVQFHPEASPEGMALHFMREEKKKQIVDEYGIETFEKMLALLEEPDELAHTHATVLPRFLNHAFRYALEAQDG